MCRNLSSAGGDAETNESSPKSSTGTDRGTRQWEVVESKKAYKLGFQEGVALFNKKPKKGVAFMQEQGMIGESPRDIALFLAKTTGLNKTMIGDYLGERDDTCIKVCLSGLVSVMCLG